MHRMEEDSGVRLLMHYWSWAFKGSRFYIDMVEWLFNSCITCIEFAWGNKLVLELQVSDYCSTTIFLTGSSVGVNPRIAKYWKQRYSLFSRFDEGIKMDEEGWYSVTPECIASRHAARCRERAVIDCFCGVGGNAIQFAKVCYHVVAIDIDPHKVHLASHNASIYGVEDYIDFVIGDFFQLGPFLKADALFLSPPWGGPAYSLNKTFKLESLRPRDGYAIFQAAQVVTQNIIMFLPRNMDKNQIEELSWLSSPPLELEIEDSYVDCHLKGITAYFGDIALVSSTSF